MNMKRFYAVTGPYCDYDWSYGSYDLDKAIIMAEKMIADGVEDVSIAAIDEDKAFCNYEIHKDDDGDWVSGENREVWQEEKKEMTYDFVSEWYLAWTEGLTDTEIRGTTKKDLVEWLTGDNSTLDEGVDAELLADKILSRIYDDYIEGEDEEQ